MTPVFTGEVHPLAEVWPRLSGDELQALADSIAEIGQIEPCTLTPDGVLVDGIGRTAACRVLGVEPWYVTNESLVDDAAIAAFIKARNAERRQLTSGQHAMGRALMLAAQGKRRNGRWEYRQISQDGEISRSDQNLLSKAGLIIDVAERASALGEEWADWAAMPSLVMSGEMTLNWAFTQAEQFDGKAQLAEDLKRQPFEHAITTLLVLTDDIEKTTIPVIPLPLTGSDRQRATDIAKRLAAASSAIRKHVKEQP